MAIMPDFTVSGDATPLFSEFMPGGGYGPLPATPTNTVYSDQYGFARNSSTRIYTKAQVWAQDPVIRRHGTYGIKCTSFHDSANRPGATTFLGMGILGKHGPDSVTPLVEGDEEWWCWSWYFPVGYGGTGSWGNLFEFGSGGASVTHPRIGSGFEASDPNTLTWIIKNGRTANPGENGVSVGGVVYTYDGTYHTLENLLGTGAPRPFTKGVWHDFIMHLTWFARSNGVAELWHREDTGPFEKLYSNKNDGTALINRAPHPTWYYNALNGYPGEFGGDPAQWLHYRMYRGVSAYDLSHDVIYWTDGLRRRQSFTAALNSFEAVTPNAPTVTSFTPTSGTAGVTSVTITGTNFDTVTSVTFNGVPAVFSPADWGYGVWGHELWSSSTSTTTLTATVPVGATTGKIQVTTSNGTGISSTDFTVGASSAPSLPDPAAGHIRIGNAIEGAYTLASPGPDTKRVILRGVGAGNVVTIDKAYFLVVGPASGGAEQLRAVVYDNDGASGLPGTFLGMSDIATVAQGASAAWVAFNFSTPVIATGDLLYFGIHFGGTGSVTFSYQSAPGHGWRLADTFSDGPSQPFGAAPVIINIEPSVVMDYTITSDTVAPIFQSATVSQTDLQLLYNEALDPAHVPAPSDYVVTVNQLIWPISSVQLSGANVQVALAQPVVTDDIVTVAYALPTLDTNKIQDLFGNKSIALTAQTVSNQTQPPLGARIIRPSARVATARRIDPSDRRTGEGGGL